ncbi:MAG: hypothetical protein J0I99_14885 [Devosia sp.]|uniref:hypothetical protein n=1 Tax=Devosia sp. TaxID=1871048 RepID=UPI001AC972F8|nr:hypothetical protein [Devosia sp.]MBN9317026.1 hypothetical protein [Devosia sp.]
MPLSDTSLFIHRSIQDLVRTPEAKLVGEGEDELVYLFGGDSAETADFGLVADLNAPNGREWTQLFHRSADNVAAVAATLRSLGVGADEIASAKKWNGKPLADLDDLKAHLTGELERSFDRSSPRQRAFLSNYWIVLDAKEQTYANLARVLALSWRTHSEQSPQVLLLNFKRAIPSRVFFSRRERDFAYKFAIFSARKRLTNKHLLQLALRKHVGLDAASILQRVVLVPDDDKIRIKEELSQAQRLVTGDIATASMLTSITAGHVAVSVDLAA